MLMSDRLHAHPARHNTMSFKTDFCVSLSANVRIQNTYIYIKSGTPRQHNRFVTISTKHKWL